MSEEFDVNNPFDVASVKYELDKASLPCLMDEYFHEQGSLRVDYNFYTKHFRVYFMPNHGPDEDLGRFNGAEGAVKAANAKATKLHAEFWKKHEKSKRRV